MFNLNKTLSLIQLCFCLIGFVVTQFDLMCNSNWGFNVFGSSLDTITSPADGNLATPQRTTCSICINPDRSGVTSDQATHCVGKCADK